MKIFNKAALAHMMLSNDTMAQEFETILNGQEIFGDMIEAGGGAEVPDGSIVDPTGGASIVDPGDDTTYIIEA